jgi:hypothetical protein
MKTPLVNPNASSYGLPEHLDPAGELIRSKASLVALER